jgi:hypothetical protein
MTAKRDGSPARKPKWDVPGLYAEPGPWFGGSFKGSIRRQGNRIEYTHNEAGKVVWRKTWPITERGEAAVRDTARQYAIQYSLDHGLTKNAIRRIAPEVLEMQLGERVPKGEKRRPNVQSTIFDACEYDRLKEFRWHANYAYTGECYVEATLRENGPPPTTSGMHRLITGAKNNEKVVHRDRNGFCNLRSNLVVTSIHDTPILHPRNTSGIPGVRRLSTKNRGYWQVQWLNQKKRYTSIFPFDLGDVEAEAEAKEQAIQCRRDVKLVLTGLI